MHALPKDGVHFAFSRRIAAESTKPVCLRPVTKAVTRNKYDLPVGTAGELEPWSFGDVCITIIIVLSVFF